MTLHLTTDHDVIAAELDRALAADPVRGTLLGTIRVSLEDTAWAATNGTGLAVRSSAEYPVSVIGPWPEPDRHALAAELARLPGLCGLSGEVPTVEALLPPGRDVKRMDQGLFRLDELTAPDGVPGTARRATEQDARIAREWYRAFMAEADAVGRNPAQAADRALAEGGCWLWHDPSGAAVSIAVRRPVFGGSARVGPVYTPPEHRGHGYGSAVTAAATADILADGAVPVLFTDLANPTSNKIYQELGYRLVENRVIATW